MAGAEIAITETKVSRIPQIVDLLTWLRSARLRTHRSRAAVMTNIPEDRRRPIMSLRPSGIFTFHMIGKGIARMPASVLHM